ncbi:UNVERIFIED_CONTAM: hypothetical protein GTU68_059368, partial [Idotea baltica]|nr:hypothetical protein [Idotea baltica]
SQSSSQTFGQTGSQGSSQTGILTGSQTGSQSSGQTGGQTGILTGGQIGTQTSSQTGSQSGSQTGSQSSSQTGSQSGIVTGSQTSSQSGSQSGSQSSSQTGSQTGSQSSGSFGSGLGASSLPDGGILGGMFGGDSSQSSSSAVWGGIFPTKPTTQRPISSQGDGDVNCDPTGVCYDVSVHCKDTRIVVQVSTTRPFNGRIYALGRSETCNVDVISSDEFRLDLTMEGQDCNTQSAAGVYTNTIVIQHHSVVMTKTDKIYKVRCTYDMSSKNITFGMMPIRDPAMIPITSAPEAPPPRIRILDATLKEVETVRIGDRLTFRIEIPEKTPYGIFARSCVAMAKDSRSTFQIIDDDGCPVEHAIFPHFVRSGSALQAEYEAFRFTESYGVIFQCNVKYCLGECEPVKCRTGKTTVQSFGRKRRGLSQQSIRGDISQTTKEEAMASSKGVSKSSDEEMSISQEILVLDLGDEQSPQYKRTSKQTVEENLFTNTTFSYDRPEVTLFETCPTRSSVLALAVTCAILLLIYVLTVFYFVMRKWSTPAKHVH